MFLLYVVYDPHPHNRLILEKRDCSMARPVSVPIVMLPTDLAFRKHMTIVLGTGTRFVTEESTVQGVWYLVSHHLRCVARCARLWYDRGPPL